MVARLITAEPLQFFPPPRVVHFIEFGQRDILSALFTREVQCIYMPAFTGTGTEDRLRVDINQLPPGYEHDRHGFEWFNYCRWRLIREMNALRQGPFGVSICRRLLAWAVPAVESRNALVSRNRGLAFLMARGRRDYEESVADGMMALIRAVELFDVTVGVQFSTYGCFAIRQRLSRSSERENRRPDAVSESAPDFTEAVTDRTPAHEAELKDVADLFRKGGMGLSRKEKSVILRRYGLGSFTGGTPVEVAAAVGLSAEWVRHLERTALAKLREWFATREHGLTPLPAKRRRGRAGESGGRRRASGRPATA